MKISRAMLIAGVSGLVIPGSGVHAQNANSGGAAAAQEPATGDIIVTATRRNERLQDTPAQVSALSGKFLDSIKAKTLQDFAAFTPGLSFQSTSPGSNLVAIRGVTTGGTQLNSAVGLYLDDVPIGSSTPTGAGVKTPDIGLFGLDRVEVLNGPQGTLFGANALGGTIRYLTKAPNLDVLSGRIEAEGGDTEHGAGNGAIRAEANAPLVDGRLAL